MLIPANVMVAKVGGEFEAFPHYFASVDGNLGFFLLYYLGGYEGVTSVVCLSFREISLGRAVAIS